MADVRGLEEDTGRVRGSEGASGKEKRVNLSPREPVGLRLGQEAAAAVSAGSPAVMLLCKEPCAALQRGLRVPAGVSAAGQTVS